MYSKDQLEAQLKSQAKNAMFERDFMIAFNRHLNLKKDAVNRTYADNKDWRDYRLEPSYKEVERFTIPDDDKY